MDSTNTVPASNDMLVQAVHDAYSATARKEVDSSCVFPTFLVYHYS